AVPGRCRGGCSPAVRVQAGAPAATTAGGAACGGVSGDLPGAASASAASVKPASASPAGVAGRCQYRGSACVATGAQPA
ncbi:hypothetical protein, partial [Streptomyces sp. NPDC008121]|uniref:hypothetical protein n=1 Tax=Streptomyces sp. NPDC008121 TaxID=3364809 RepID=UPI0036EB992F